MREIITLSAHPSNLDPAAQHVADMSGEFPGPVVASVYRVTGGYVATVPNGRAFAGLFTTQGDAADAIREYARTSKGAPR